jgi:hypothetical protein
MSTFKLTSTTRTNYSYAFTVGRNLFSKCGVELVFVSFHLSGTAISLAYGGKTVSELSMAENGGPDESATSTLKDEGEGGGGKRTLLAPVAGTKLPSYQKFFVSYVLS